MSTIDTTEPLRRKLVAEINSRASDPVSDRARLEAEYGPGNVWDTDELRRDFNVVGFAAPFVSVVRRADGKHGSLEFQHSPRLYFDFKEDGLNRRCPVCGKLAPTRIIRNWSFWNRVFALHYIGRGAHQAICPNSGKDAC